MAREPARPDEWTTLDVYPELFAAEIDAGFLRSEGVAARVERIGDFPGHERGARLLVDFGAAHRARWLLKLRAVDEEELCQLATAGSGDAGEP